MTPYISELRDQLERYEIENAKLRTEIVYAVECLELIEKLQVNGNTVDVQDIVKRLKQSI